VSTTEYGRVPFVPQGILSKHRVHEPTDGRFRAAARLRQALLREERRWPIGHYQAAEGKRRRLGNYVAVRRQQTTNFITPEIAHLARREIAYREDGALIDEGRLWGNMLSSAPAVFNVLGALKLDLKLATSVLRSLCPDLVPRVTGVLFEHSPARRHPDFTNDRTAFDAVFKCQTVDGRHAFVAIELKYTESMAEPPAKTRPRYDELSRSSQLFRDPDDISLRGNPLQQFWRQHLLAHAMVENGLYSKGRFIVIAPSLNTPVQHAIQQYRQQLSGDSASVDFDAFTLEALIAAIKRAGASKVAKLLFERYCDFSSVDALI
jgi:hypothetical protein